MFELIEVKYRDVLDLPHFVTEPGKITTLVGSSGSGKTTLLKLLNKILSPTQGRILYKGIDLRELNSIAHRREVIMLSQNPVMFAGSLRDNLTIGHRFQERDLPADDVLQAMLADVKLDKPLDGSVDTLSGGEKQRVAIARVLLLNPTVYLMDEPSSALDETTAELIIKLLTDHVRKHGKTMVMVTHSPDIAAKFSDTIVELAAGRCVNRREINERHP